MPSRPRAGPRASTPTAAPAPTNPTTYVEDVEEQAPFQEPPDTPAQDTHPGGAPVDTSFTTGRDPQEGANNTNPVIDIDFWDSNTNPEVVALNHLISHVMREPDKSKPIWKVLQYEGIESWRTLLDMSPTDFNFLSYEDENGLVVNLQRGHKAKFVLLSQFCCTYMKIPMDLISTQSSSMKIY